MYLYVSICMYMYKICNKIYKSILECQVDI